MKCKLVLILIAGCSAALAQRTNGFVYAAPGAAVDSYDSVGTLQVGGGGEYLIGKGIAAGAEVGALAPRQNWSGVVGMFSPGVSYHFVHNPRNKFDPYVIGGYSLMFRTEHANLGNFGVGMNYWFHRRVGLRVEFRDHISANSGQAVHFWGIRFGASFR